LAAGGFFLSFFLWLEGAIRKCAALRAGENPIRKEPEMVFYQLRFKSLPRFEKYFRTQDELIAYLDSVGDSAGKPDIKVREIKDEYVRRAS